MYFALTLGSAQILIVFGALKIGTRLEKNNPVKNDYFLIGNLITIIIALSYHQLYALLVARPF